MILFELQCLGRASHILHTALDSIDTQALERIGRTDRALMVQISGDISSEWEGVGDIINLHG